MIIPIKCFNCGTVIADKHRYYESEVRRRKLRDGLNVDRVIYLTSENVTKTPEGEVLDELGLTKQCCRIIMMTHVNIE